ncbi:MAG: MATE family efflux transporter [Eubacteriales bacterium]|nr:MATE family efflux transporter [Eubacteriales bacterium]MDD3881826.1 MATE family efflux transporter [Eubacteriales bacterium]MDD4512928.1 MATE family efflux transporter [Eubacteriales bacterium]
MKLPAFLRRPDASALTEGVIWKQLLLFFFPIVFGSFFQQLYNTVDAMIVGRYLGKEALSAVGGSTGSLVALFVNFFIGLGSGATVVISQRYGAGDVAGVSKSVHTAVALSLGCGAFLTVAGIALTPWALTAMDTPAAILPHAITYMRVYFGGIVFNLLYNMSAGILRAVGDSRRPLLFLICGCAANIALDLLFVAVCGFGVAGAAVATVLSQVLSVFLCMITLTRTTECYRLGAKQIRFYKEPLKSIVRIGTPAGLQSVMYCIANVLIQVSVNSFGTDTVAGWTVYGKIDGLFWMTINAFGIAITTFVGQNFGAMKLRRVRDGVRQCMLITAGVTVTLSLLLYFFGGSIYWLFIDEQSVVDAGVRILKALVPTYITYIAIEILAGAVRGTGDALWPMIMTCLGVCVTRILWIYLAVPVWHDIIVLMLCYPLSWVLTTIMFIWYYKNGAWLRRRLRAVGHPELYSDFTGKPAKA